MQHIVCSACNQQALKADSFSLRERLFCHACLEQFLATHGNERLYDGAIKRLSDATVCVNCKADGGAAEYGLLAGAPVCETCTKFFRNRPFPNWLKVAVAAILCFTVFAFVYNWRFLAGYVEILRGNRALAKGNIEEGARLWDSAAERLPDYPELAALPNMLNATMLLRDDKTDEALARLQKSQRHVPQHLQSAYQTVQAQAEAGHSFNQKDYDGFLSAANRYLVLHPNDPMALGQMASAYACKFATTGNPDFRDKCLSQLTAARANIGDDKAGVEEYEQRIRHRLATREIISREEFHKRFPNGWKKD